MIPKWAIKTESDKERIRQGATWDSAKARQIIQFAHTFFRSQFIVGTFRLLKWQKEFLQSIVAWRWPDGTRCIRNAHLHIAKKNGKNLVISILAKYELYFSEEPSAYIGACAASKENATQIFSELAFSIRNTPFNDYTNIIDHQKRIEVKSLNSKLRTFASDGKNVHGEPLSLCLL